MIRRLQPNGRHRAPRQDRLDPIDWATYEPYLWANEACFYQRAGVLAGSLGCLQPLHAGASGKLPASAETNTMNVSPALPRFAYLPISQPQVGDRPKVRVPPPPPPPL